MHVVELTLAHTWLAFGFVSKTGCDKSGIRAVLTVGREPRVELVVSKDFGYLALAFPIQILAI